MPFAGFEDFNACVLAQTDKGHSDESARRICGAIKAKVENNTKEFEAVTLSEDEKKVVEECTQAVNMYTERLDNVEVFMSGTWNKDKYSEQDLKDMVQNFNELKEHVKPPAKIGHSEDQTFLKKEGLPAAGWVDKLQLVGNKVVASFRDVPKVVKDLITKKAYKRVSAEIYPKYKDPTSGKIYKNVLRAVAFLGGDIPAVETLSDIQALYAKSPDGAKWYTFDNSEFERRGGVYMAKWFKITIDGEQQKEELVKKLSDAMGVKVNVEDGAMVDEEEQKKRAEEDKKIQDAEAQNKKIEELTQQYQAVSKLQGDKDKEIADLKAKIAELEQQLSGKSAEVTGFQKKFEEMEKNTKTKSIKMFVKQAIKDGKVLPAQEGVIVALMEQLDDKAVVKYTQDEKEVSLSHLEAFKKHITESPVVVNFSEVSPSTEVEHKITDNKVSIGGVQYGVENMELVQKAEKYAQENNVAFDVAILEVSKEK